MTMRATYGRPPVFAPALFFKVLAAALTLVALAFALIVLISGPMTRVDVVGTLVCSPIAAYLVHLWLLPMDG
jgi:hypothetical protein